MCGAYCCSRDEMNVTLSLTPVSRAGVVFRRRGMEGTLFFTSVLSDGVVYSTGNIMVGER